MLTSNGRNASECRNYHMSITELTILLKFVKDKYDPKWFVAIMIQFSLGLRASEMLAIQVQDFKDHFRLLDYRQAKTNRMIYNEPVPEPLAKLIITYIFYNQHRLKDGFLFSNYTGKGRKITTETYGAFWTKWRRAIAKTHSRFKDNYLVNGHVRYRISSHSLRRLHRTVLRNNIKDLYIVKELCNYSDYATLERYINAEELMSKKADYLLPIFNPLVSSLSMQAGGQRQLRAWM